MRRFIKTTRCKPTLLLIQGDFFAQNQAARSSIEKELQCIPISVSDLIQE